MCNAVEQVSAIADKARENSTSLYDSGPRVHLVAFRLLHLSSTRNLRHPAPALTGRIQNAAARLVTGTRRCDQVTSVLQRLHWLPVRRRVEFKLPVLVCDQQPGTTVCVRRLPVRCHHRAPSASIIRQFQVHYHLVHVLKIEHSLLPEHAFGTVFLHPST